MMCPTAIHKYNDVQVGDTFVRGYKYQSI